MLGIYHRSMQEFVPDKFRNLENKLCSLQILRSDKYFPVVAAGTLVTTAPKSAEQRFSQNQRPKNGASWANTRWKKSHANSQTRDIYSSRINNPFHVFFQRPHGHTADLASKLKLPLSATKAEDHTSPSIQATMPYLWFSGGNATYALQYPVYWLYMESFTKPASKTGSVTWVTGCRTPLQKLHSYRDFITQHNWQQ